jgi:hypothetical protein
MAQLDRVKIDEKRAIGRMKISDAGYRLRFKKVQQSPNLLMGIDRDLLAKVDEERLVARGLESRAFGQGCQHDTG